LVQKGKGDGHTEEYSSVRFCMIRPNNWTLRYQIWYVSVMTLRYPIIDVGSKGQGHGSKVNACLCQGNTAHFIDTYWTLLWMGVDIRVEWYWWKKIFCGIL